MRIKVVNVFAHSNGTYSVTLQRKNLLVTCVDMDIWDEASVDEDLFEEWVEYAREGHEGYGVFYTDVV